MNKEKKDIKRFRLVFVGDQGVGKTSIIQRFMTSSFDQSIIPTVGIDFISKIVQVEGTKVRLQLWDTAGQQRFKSLIPSYARQADVCMIVYDITNRQSFDNLQVWMDFINQNKSDECILVTIGNKIDSQQNREISQEQVQNQLKKIQVKNFKTSAKTGQNIQNVMKQVSKLLINRGSEQNKIKIDLKVLSKKRQGCKC